MIEFDDPFVYSRHVLLEGWMGNAAGWVGKKMAAGAGRAAGGLETAAKSTLGGALKPGAVMPGIRKSMGLGLASASGGLRRAGTWMGKNPGITGGLAAGGLALGAGSYGLAKLRNRQKPSMMQRTRNYFGV
jgi:hypothetical protein